MGIEINRIVKLLEDLSGKKYCCKVNKHKKLKIKKSGR
jgi:hypothetical protein